MLKATYLLLLHALFMVTLLRLPMLTAEAEVVVNAVNNVKRRRHNHELYLEPLQGMLKDVEGVITLHFSAISLHPMNSDYHQVYQIYHPKYHQ